MFVVFESGDVHGAPGLRMVGGAISLAAESAERHPKSDTAGIDRAEAGKKSKVHGDLRDWERQTGARDLRAEICRSDPGAWRKKIENNWQIILLIVFFVWYLSIELRWQFATEEQADRETKSTAMRTKVQSIFCTVVAKVSSLTIIDLLLTLPAVVGMVYGMIKNF